MIADFLCMVASGLAILTHNKKIINAVRKFILNRYLGVTTIDDVDLDYDLDYDVDVDVDHDKKTLKDTLVDAFSDKAAINEMMHTN